jgi:hypothetical protein
MLLSRPTLIALLAATSATAQVDPATGLASFTLHERVEIMATNIVRGVLRLRDPSAIDQAVHRGGAYVEFDVTVQDTLKGNRLGNFPLVLFVAPTDHPHQYSPHADDLRRLVGRECILHLHPVGKRYFLAESFRGTSLVEESPKSLEAVRQRVAQHAKWADTVPEASVAYANEVTALLQQIAQNPDEEALGFAKLLRLGPLAIPAIVRHLDDSRPLKNREIILTRTRPDSREPLVRFHPNTIGDALMPVLQQMSGQNFGYSDHLMGDDRRQTAIAGWRIYAHYVLSESLAARGTGGR